MCILLFLPFILFFIGSIPRARGELAEDKGTALGCREDMPLTIKVQGRDLHGNGDNGNRRFTAVMEATAVVIPR